MGKPITLNLLKAGYDLTVYDIDSARVQHLVSEGATGTQSIAALIDATDVVFIMLPHDASVLSVLTEDATLRRLSKRNTVVDLSTISPKTSEAIDEVLHKCGAAYLRAPVSGSTASAAEATLSIFCSGPRASFDSCLPLFQTIGNRQVYAGEREEARHLKLLVNMVVGSTPALVGEALAWGLRAGLPWETMIDVLIQSAAASPVLLYKAKMMKAKDWTAMATIDIAAKDLDLALCLGAELEAPMPFTTLAQTVNQSYQETGRGSLDFFSTVAWAVEADNATTFTTSRILDLERARSSAMMRGDVAALEKLLEDNLIYHHSNGETDSKPQYLDRLSGGLRYLDIRHTEQRVKDLGSTAIVSSRMEAELVRPDGQRVLLDSRATAVWHRFQREWKLVSFQASPLAK